MRYYIEKINKSMDDSELIEGIINNPPATWNKYPNNLLGAFSIVTMEYEEIRQDTQNKDYKNLLMNIDHLRAALVKYRRLVENE